MEERIFKPKFKVIYTLLCLAEFVIVLVTLSFLDSDWSYFYKDHLDHSNIINIMLLVTLMTSFIDFLLRISIKKVTFSDCIVLQRYFLPEKTIQFTDLQSIEAKSLVFKGYTFFTGCMKNGSELIDMLFYGREQNLLLSNTTGKERNRKTWLIPSVITCLGSFFLAILLNIISNGAGISYILSLLLLLTSIITYPWYYFLQIRYISI